MSPTFTWLGFFWREQQILLRCHRQMFQEAALICCKALSSNCRDAVITRPHDGDVTSQKPTSKHTLHPCQKAPEHWRDWLKPFEGNQSRSTRHHRLPVKTRRALWQHFAKWGVELYSHWELQIAVCTVFQFTHSITVCIGLLLPQHCLLTNRNACTILLLQLLLMAAATACCKPNDHPASWKITTSYTTTPTDWQDDASSLTTTSAAALAFQSKLTQGKGRYSPEGWIH